MKYLIVGGGVAGTTCAEELRKLDTDAEITIVSEENHPLYSRVLLPHYAMGKVPREKCFLKTYEWYAEQKIELLEGQRAVKLDTENKFVELDNARELPYDKLVIAAGTEPRLEIGEPRGVGYFWTIDDADHLVKLLGEPGHKSAVIHGGGFIACEFLNLFAQHELKTTVVLRGEYFWNRFLEKKTALYFMSHLKKQGVEFVANVKEFEVMGKENVKAIRADGVETRCSVLGVAIGNELDHVWLQDAGIAIGAGIKTNEYLETNVADVYAVGDVAESYDPVVDRQYLAGNWGRALMMGRTLAKTLTGKRIAFRHVSSYAINVLGLDVTFIGDTDKEAADMLKIEQKELGLAQFMYRKRKLVGAAIFGKGFDRNKLTQEIGS